MVKNIFLTGRVGVGKTTLLKKLVARCGYLALTGFYTEEIRENGVRVGFKAVTLSGSSSLFAHIHFRASPAYQVGKYGVKPEVFEAFVLPHLHPHRKGADLMVIDEIAKMELISHAFKERLIEVLDSDCPVLGVISLKGIGVIKRIKERRDVRVFTVTPQNRDVLGEQVYRKLGQILG